MGQDLAQERATHSAPMLHPLLTAHHPKSIIAAALEPLKRDAERPPLSVHGLNLSQRLRSLETKPALIVNVGRCSSLGTIC